MAKDRDQLTPAEPEDRGKIRPHRSADREATSDVDRSTGPGPASHGSDPAGVDEMPATEREEYR